MENRTNSIYKTKVNKKTKKTKKKQKNKKLPVSQNLMLMWSREMNQPTNRQPVSQNPMLMWSREMNQPTNHQPVSQNPMLMWCVSGQRPSQSSTRHHHFPRGRDTQLHTSDTVAAEFARPESGRLQRLNHPSVVYVWSCVWYVFV